MYSPIAVIRRIVKEARLRESKEKNYINHPKPLKPLKPLMQIKPSPGINMD